eukprot:m.419899 g.419899  ORF g.419899 m.419899 type:complete len:812 (-) comp21311_c0_seq1:210-2645(-)
MRTRRRLDHWLIPITSLSGPLLAIWICLTACGGRTINNNAIVKPSHIGSEFSKQSRGHHSWAVHLPSITEQEASQIAGELGLVSRGAIGGLDGYFRFETVKLEEFIATLPPTSSPTLSPTVPCTSKDEAEAALTKHNGVVSVRYQKPRARVRREQSSHQPRILSVQRSPTLSNNTTPQTYTEPSDPLYSIQWYLQASGEHRLFQDHPWQMDVNGSGVVIAIVDDGLETDHPDISENFDPKASRNFNERSKEDPKYGIDDSSPYPDRSNVINKHGTRCAGAAGASANNDVCGVGVAYGAKIGGIRMLDGVVDDAIEGGSLSFNNQYIDIYSSSWGPADSGTDFDGPEYLASKALYYGVTEGRQGLGNIFIWASGNGGNKDQCNCDGYVNSPYTIAISSADSNGALPYYGEKCTAIMATTFPGTVTTDLFGTCTSKFYGTSAAAPVAAGIVALVLDANPCLTWREVQHIIAHAAIPHGDDRKMNGGGYWVSPSFGFGFMNASHMVELAKTWVPLGDAVKLSFVVSSMGDTLESSDLVESTDVSGCNHDGDVCISALEQVELMIHLTTEQRGKLNLILVSPYGTSSALLRPRAADTQSGTLKWTFLSLNHWGESPKGKWTLFVMDEAKTTRLHRWSLVFRGVTTWNASKIVGDGKSPVHVLPNGCTVCGPATFRDQNGMCYECHSSCARGCTGPGEEFCIDKFQFSAHTIGNGVDTTDPAHVSLMDRFDALSETGQVVVICAIFVLVLPVVFKVTFAVASKILNRGVSPAPALASHVRRTDATREDDHQVTVPLIDYFEGDMTEGHNTRSPRDG